MSRKKQRGPMPKSTETTWVSRDPDGYPKVVKVVDMENSHIQRWIAYFRRKFREIPGEPVMTDDQVDAKIAQSIVTAPAIFEEAKRRGLYVVHSTSGLSCDRCGGAMTRALHGFQYQCITCRYVLTEKDLVARAKGAGAPVTGAAAPIKPGKRLITLED